MDTTRISEAIGRAAKEAAHEILPKLRQSIFEKVEAELCPMIEALPPTGTEITDLLRQAVVGLQESASQTEILNALLDGAERFSGRTGLLIVRGGFAVGWQAHRLDPERFKRLQVDCSRGVVHRAIQSRAMATGEVTEVDPNFAARFGSPSDGNCAVLPFCVRERVAAVLYADCGDGDPATLDVSALDILIRIASLWLEVVAARQSSQPPQPQIAPSQPAPPVHSSPSAPAQTEQVPVVQEAPVSVPPPQTATPAPPQIVPVVDDEVRNKARRFAKLLVEEIKLYNQSKVVEGRANRDLYARLKDDIEKSRAAYRKRFGEYITDTDYFSSELVRVLADNDPTLLGPNFPS